MTKTLEERKAEALELFENTILMFDPDGFKISLEYLPKEIQETITELLQPMPTDDEVEEAVRYIQNAVLCEPIRINPRHKEAVETLIRRAKQPSCDGLVLALERIRATGIGASDEVTEYNTGLHIVDIAEQALAEHRKGECDDNTTA